MGHEPDRLEQEFFGQEHTALLAELRAKSGRQAQRDALREMVRVESDAFLDRLITLGIGPEKALALRLIPLVCVAWADGEVDERERDAVLRAATERGVVAERIGRILLRDWLTHRPDPRLLESWKATVGRIWNRFTDDEQWAMRRNLHGSAREVAQAAGGFLGLGRISAQEQAVLDELEAALG